MDPEARRKPNEKRRRSDAASEGEAERACAELVLLASEKLGRPLIHAELKLIQGLNQGVTKHSLTDGHYARLYRGYSRDELLGWFKGVAETRKELEEIQREIDAVTPTQVRQACAEVMRIATEKLGRTLTRAEQRVIGGFNKVLLAGGEVAELFRGCSPQELLDNLNEAGAGPGPVALLRSLANAPCSPELGRGRIIEYLARKERRALKGVQLSPTLEQFTRWFLDTLRADPPGRKIRALYFGVVETKAGCMLHVSGANAYADEDFDSDWACTTDWLPKGRVAPLGLLSEIWNRLRKTSDENWVVVLGITILIVRAFFRKHHTEFTKLTGLKRICVACGFDDGDSYILRTPLSPKA